MTYVSLREARAHLRDLTRKASTGEPVILTRRGQKVARLIPPRRKPKPFPRMGEFRASLGRPGQVTKENTVVRSRKDERF